VREEYPVSIRKLLMAFPQRLRNMQSCKVTLRYFARLKWARRSFDLIAGIVHNWKQAAVGIWSSVVSL